MEMFERKKIVLTELKKGIQQEINTLKTRMEGTKQRMIDAPGAMQSHHDTYKVETGWLMDGFGKQAVLLEGAMGAIDRLTASMDRKDERFRVTVGALVRLEGENMESVYYLIMKNGQGRKIEVDGITAVVIDPSAPIAIAIIGKEAGDVVAIKGREMEVSEII